MNLGQLISLARTRTRDKVVPYFWSDDEFTEFANSAVTEACARARLLQSQVHLAVTPGQKTVTVPYTMLKPLSVLFVDQLGGTVSAGNFIVGRWYTILTPGTTVFTTVGAANSTVGTLFQATGVGTGTGTAILGRESWLNPVSQRVMLEASAFAITPSRPTHFSRGIADNTIQTYPVSNIAGTLVATIARMPTTAEELVSTTLTGVPVIPIEFHRDLVYWMLSEAYSVMDADQGDKKKQEFNEEKFEKRFGKKVTALGEAQGRKNVVGTDMRAQPYGGAAGFSSDYFNSDR